MPDAEFEDVTTRLVLLDQMPFRRHHRAELAPKGQRYRVQKVVLARISRPVGSDIERSDGTRPGGEDHP